MHLYAKRSPNVTRSGSSNLWRRRPHLIASALSTPFVTFRLSTSWLPRLPLLTVLVTPPVPARVISIVQHSQPPHPTECALMHLVAQANSTSPPGLRLPPTDCAQPLLSALAWSTRARPILITQTAVALRKQCARAAPRTLATRLRRRAMQFVCP
jgi:hypothetical protein